MNKGLYIFGTGNYGHRLHDWLENVCNVRVEGFIKTVKEADENYFEGLKVYDLDGLPDDHGLILIAIADRSTVAGVRSNLIIRKEVRPEEIIDCSSFIETNLLAEGDCFCLICGKRLNSFERGGFTDSDLFETHHVIGAGIRDNCRCPECTSNDRIRWIYYVLFRYTDAFRKNCDILHFAPESGLSEQLRYFSRSRTYITADIEKGVADISVDITDIPFRDGLFDMVIVNHVLEHIQDENKALQELARILKPEGIVILSFPICSDLDTYDDPKITDRKERLRVFGQEDHVRLYGRDYKEHIEKSGFEVTVYSPKGILQESKIKEYGFIEDDVVLVCRKKK